VAVHPPCLKMARTQNNYEELFTLLDAMKPGCLGARRASSHCRFAPPPIRFIPDLLTYSVPLVLKRRCDRTLGERSQFHEYYTKPMALGQVRLATGRANNSGSHPKCKCKES
jgi:hypothetical protein